LKVEKKLKKMGGKKEDKYGAKEKVNNISDGC
jgi:hypothetical protein